MAKSRRRIRQATMSAGADDLYLREVRRFPQLTKAERTARVWQVADVEERNRTAELNLPLVIKIATSYWRQLRGSLTGLDFLDLVQEGNIGLLEAIKRFNPKKGCQFSTYATFWIRKAIIRLLSNSGRVIRIPIRKLEALFRLNKVMGHLQAMGRAATAEEIAQEMQVPINRIQELLEYLKILTVESLDAPYEETDDGSREEPFLPELIHDHSMPDPFELIVVQEILDRYRQAEADNITSLRTAGVTEREIEIYRMRFGYDSIDQRPSFQEIGAHFGVSRQRIDEICGRLEKILAKQAN